VASSPRLIAVTGATGFTGQFAAHALAVRFPQARLRCLVRPTSNTRPLSALDCEFIVGDLHDPEALNRLLSGADTVVNVASLGFDWTDPLLDAIHRSPVVRGVFLSTTAMLTRLPVKSKPIRERAEQLVMQSGVAWTILRPTMIYGTDRDRNISRLLRFIRRSPIIPVPAAVARQQPVHVEDVATAIVQALATDLTFQRAYNIAGATAITFEQLVREATNALGVRRLIVRVPTSVLVALVRAQSAVGGSFLTVEQVQRLAEDKAFDYADAARDFGYAPRSFSEGVRQEVALLTRERPLTADT
jgi:uncharacterized protein YbjT (DUF2867 family)